jgi:hypothetical protein
MEAASRHQGQCAALPVALAAGIPSRAKDKGPGMDVVRWGWVEAGARRDPVPHVRLHLTGLDPAHENHPDGLRRSTEAGTLRLSPEDARRLRDDLTAAIAVIEEAQADD